MMVEVTASSIDLFGRCIFTDDFEVDGSNCERPGLVLHELQSAAPPSPAPVRFPQVELVDESIAAEILETIAEGQHNVADRAFALADQPGAAEGRIAQEGQQRDAGFRFVKRVSVEGVVLAHHLEHEVSIGVGGDVKRGFRGQGTFSMASAMPMPPLTQRVATPRWARRLRISCRSVTVMRVPVQPMG